MSISTPVPGFARLSQLFTRGTLLLVLAIFGAGLYFWPGIQALLIAWQTPEYSHGPIIPILSAWLWLKQLKEVPVQPGPKSDRWPGVAVLILSLLFGAVGILSNIGDIVAYALIVWVGGMVLISWGWKEGRQFWPPVLHLVYMLPLPGVIYYKVSTALQFISSELGVWFLKLLSVPVFLEGNIIDLGVTKLHVAEACSGLRYMFPIMSFSYVFAVLYRGPTWHKAVLLISAVPIAIFMNSVRIAIAGVIVDQYGLAWVEGFSHFFEGWVIFVACIILLFALAWLMLRIHPEHRSLSDALDLDFSGIGDQAMRLGLVRPSKALIAATLLIFASVAAVYTLPDRNAAAPARENFAQFPRQIDDWSQIGPPDILDASVARSLAADDYHQVSFTKPGIAAPVGLFMAWYNDQSQGGVHSPEICLPGSGWEIAWLERSDLTQEMGSPTPFHLNRAIIQKGETRMMVYYWFQQKNRRIAWDFAAKFWLMVDGVRSGRSDGALVRLTTAIRPGESDAQAEARLRDMLKSLNVPLPRFIPAE